MRARAAILAALLYAQAGGTAIALSYLLDRYGLKMPMIRAGGPAGAGVGAVVGMFMVGGATIGLSLAAGSAALLAKRFSGHEWKVAALCAAVWVNVLQLAHGIDGPNANVFLSVDISWALLAGISLLRPDRPFITASVLPSIAAIGAVLYSAHGTIDHALHDAASRTVNEIEELAEQRKDAELRSRLEKVDSRDQDLDLASALQLLLIRGDYLPQVDLILHHPNTPLTACTRLLKATYDADEGAFRSDTRALDEGCARAVVALAARRNRPSMLDAALTAFGKSRAAVFPLYDLLSAEDPIAALRMLAAAGLLDRNGRLDARYYDEDLLGWVWSHMDREPQKRFFAEHADVDALFVASITYFDYPDRARYLFKHGAHANGRSPGGSTALSAFLSAGHSSTLQLRFLLDAGADANLAAAPYDRRRPDQPAGPAEPPLWLLLRAGSEGEYVKVELLRMLLHRGADPDSRVNGRSIVEAFPKLSPEAAKLLSQARSGR